MDAWCSFPSLWNSHQHASKQDPPLLVPYRTELMHTIPSTRCCSVSTATPSGTSLKLQTLRKHRKIKTRYQIHVSTIPTFAKARVESGRAHLG
ncbi:hypothetical protein PF005_g19792 [Phytophthora fragariae]|uniref:Uncharacterized protein n=1 Tax=Phytophthora fragariae TaxID=53985 RepID=A0A6A3WU92_9STRA|nr:hypothetical protein PF005_g19792 [Phytophthora fragariae]